MKKIILTLLATAAFGYATNAQVSMDADSALHLYGAPASYTAPPRDLGDGVVVSTLQVCKGGNTVQLGVDGSKVKEVIVSDDDLQCRLAPSFSIMPADFLP